MKNYKYLLKNKKEVILNEKEHSFIQEAISQKKEGLIRLRNNTLGFDTALIGEFFETDELTALEEKAREEYLALPPDQRPKTELPRLTGNTQYRGGGFQKILGNGGFKECAECKVQHFIPENKTICLGCLPKICRREKMENKEI